MAKNVIYQSNNNELVDQESDACITSIKIGMTPIIEKQNRKTLELAILNKIVHMTPPYAV